MKFQNLTIYQATNDKLKILEDAITDDNIRVARELPKAVIKRLDFIAEDATGQLCKHISIVITHLLLRTNLT